MHRAFQTVLHNVFLGYTRGTSRAVKGPPTRRQDAFHSPLVNKRSDEGGVNEFRSAWRLSYRVRPFVILYYTMFPAICIIGRVLLPFLLDITVHGISEFFFFFFFFSLHSLGLLSKHDNNIN